MDELIVFDGIALLDDANAGFVRGDGSANLIIGEDGDDLLVGRGGDDLIIGGGFSDGDTLHIDLYGGDQNADALDIDGPEFDGQDTLLGGDGNDTLIGGSWADGQGTVNARSDSGDDLGGDLGVSTTILDEAPVDDGLIQAEETRIAGDGDVFISIFPHPFANEMWGGAGNDLIYTSEFGDTVGGGSGNDSIYGGDGADRIYGGGGDDSIVAGAGNDIIWGSAGSDGITGGDGNDVFAFKDGHGIDYVRDFSVNDDTLRIVATNTAFNSAEDVIAAASASFGPADEPGVRIETGDGDAIFLVGILESQLSDISYDFGG